jgi:hypothetical protein
VKIVIIGERIRVQYLCGFARELGHTAIEIATREMTAVINREQPDAVFVNCDSKDGTAALKELTSPAVRPHIVGFGFLEKPAAAARYLRLPITIREFVKILPFKEE